jgi:hypothetical protein
LHVLLDAGTSNAVAANTFGLVVDHSIANTSQARLVAPRAFLAFKDNAGSGSNTTTYLLDIGAQGNTVSANLTTGNGTAMISAANNYTLLGINRTIRIVVNGTTLYLLASTTTPSNA